MAKSTGDKKNRIQNYIRGLEQRLEQRVPEKHKHRPEVYKEWLMLEIKKAKASLEKP